MLRNQKYLAICDKPSQVVQIACLAKMYQTGKGSIKLGDSGENLVIVILNTLSINGISEQDIRSTLDHYHFQEASIVHFEPTNFISEANLTKIVEINRVTKELRAMYPREVAGIFCSLLSQAFVKIHLDTYANAPIYLLEDGLGSYLHMPIKNCAILPHNYSHKGVVLGHLKRVVLANLPITQEYAPQSHVDEQYVEVDIGYQEVNEMKSLESRYIGLNKSKRMQMHASLIEYWKDCSLSIDMEYRPQVIVLGQYFHVFCKNFYYRDEVEMYTDTLNRVLKMHDRVMFIPHPKAPLEQADHIRKGVDGDVEFFQSSTIPAEAFFLLDTPPEYAVGYFSSAMWNITEVLQGEAYTALGWPTQRLYDEMSLDIQRQGYRAARQKFFPLEKLEKVL